MWYLFLGMLYFCIGTTAVCGNFIVLKIFSSFPALRTPANMLVMNLAFSDFCLMLALFPEMVYNFFMGGSWQFGETACQIHAFLGSVFGYSQIFTLTVISWDRHNVIVKGFSGAPLTFSKVSMILIINYIWSIGWAVAPLVGFGGYGLDGILGTCSYDYVTQTFTNQISILLLCIFNYLVPLFIILWAYYGIVQAVFKHEDELRQQAKKMNVASLRSNADQQSASAEIRIAKVAIINVTLWTLAWTPFTVICMLGTWGDVKNHSPRFLHPCHHCQDLMLLQPRHLRHLSPEIPRVLERGLPRHVHCCQERGTGSCPRQRLRSHPGSVCLNIFFIIINEEITVDDMAFVNRTFFLITGVFNTLKNSFLLSFRVYIYTRNDNKKEFFSVLNTPVIKKNVLFTKAMSSTVISSLMIMKNIFKQTDPGWLLRRCRGQEPVPLS